MVLFIYVWLVAAPELLRMKEDGDGYGSAVDIWSLGVLLYTALTNCTPFPQFGNFIAIKYMRIDFTGF